jgi:hypothetical protein
MRYAASAVLELKYLPLGTKISNLCTQKAALHEAIVLPALRPDLFQGIRTPPKVLRRAKSRFFFVFYTYIFVSVHSPPTVLRRASRLGLTSTKVLAYYSTEVPAY